MYLRTVQALGVTIIEKGTFYGCSSLKSVIIPNGITEIRGIYEQGAFSGCKSLESITLPDSVTTIGRDAFRSCSSLTSVSIPDSVTEIEDGAFAYCTSFTSVTIPDNVQGIGGMAFGHCINLKSVTIPDSITVIGSCSFRCCVNLASITIPKNVTSIGSEAFSDYKSFTSVTIPDHVRRIGARAFSNCTNLKSVTIPNGITQIEKDYYGGAFSGCTSLEKIITPDFEIKIYNHDEIYKQFCLVALRDLSLEVPYKAKYDIILQMFVQKPDDKELFSYVKKSFTKILKSAIDNNDVETISAVCKRKDLLNKKNIDNLIEYAIQHTQRGGTVEIQALLMRYKNENIGFSTPNFRI